MSFCRSSQYTDGRAAMLILSRFRGAMLLLLTLVALQACSPAKGSTTPSVSPLALAQTATVPVRLGVQIASPLDGAQLPESAPIEIEFTASGGPFLQASLLIDGTVADTLPITSQQPQYSGALHWDSPFPGSHRLVIQVTTAENQIATAEVSIRVGTVSPASPTSVSTSTGETISFGGMEIRFVNLTNGGNVQGMLDASGRPQVLATIEVTGPAPASVGLFADSVLVASGENPSGTSPFRADFLWSPATGADTYVLRAEAANADKSAAATVQITITVTGIPTIAPTPTPALMDPETAKRRTIELYHEEFGLNLTAPTLAKKDRYGVVDPWVSVAYVGDKLYELNLYLDGHAQGFITPVGHEITSEIRFASAPVCRPAGAYSMLVVFVDYGNLGITQEEALSALQQATEVVNAAYAHSSAAAGQSTPILQLETTGWFVSPPPPMATYLLTPDLIRSITGMDPKEFDWLAQVDLDASNTSRNYFREQAGIDTFPFGSAATSCGATAKDVNIWVILDEKSQMYGEQNRLTGVLLSHEVLHLLGYPGTHIWPCGDGTTPDATDSCDYTNMPTLMLGWTDTDGDGTVEILDSTPYGMATP